MIISTAAHIAVLVLFIFLVAWRAPNPPHPEIGIELNFGTSDAGSGDQQPEPFTPPTETESEEDAPETPEEVIEEVPEEPVEEVVEDLTPVEETVEEVVETTETEEAVQPVTEQPTETPVKEPEVKEEKKEEVKEEKKEEVKEEKKEVDKQPETDIRATYPGTGKNNPTKSNEGDDADKLGDKGKEAGDIVSKAYDGSQGGGADGDGEGLNMPGWIMDREPRPQHGPVQNGGKIVFDFKVDDKGNVYGVIVDEFTVSRELVEVYKRELENITLSKTSPGAAPPESKGRITFIIRAN